MRRYSPTSRLRAGRSAAAVIIYLAGFVAILLLMSKYYLFPAIRVSQSADPQAKKVMSLFALLVMLLTLLILFVGLLITFRVGRFFRPRQITPGKPTVYIDAWAESGRRMQATEEDEDE